MRAKSSLLTSFQQYRSFHATNLLRNTEKSNVIVFGGTGFLGRQVIKQISPHVGQVIVASRYPENASKTLSQDNGNIKFEKVNVTDVEKVSELIQGAQVVINLVNAFYESENTFAETFIDGSKHIAHAARRVGVSQLIKVGCLGAEVDGPSRWGDIVYRGEDMTFAAFPEATILRTALMFGQGSKVVDKFVSVTKSMPVVPLPASTGRFQPVWVEDVARAILACVQDKQTIGKTYDLAGPKIYNSAEELLKAIIRASSGSDKSIVTVPRVFYDGVLSVSQMLPEPVFTRDHLGMIDADMTASDKNPAIEQLIKNKPAALEDVLALQYRGVKQ